MAVSAIASPHASGELLTDLYNEHAGPLYGYARYLTTSVHDAEDLVQITFMQAYRTLEHGEEIEHPRAWLMTTMRRRAFNLTRDRHDVATESFAAEAALTDVTASASANEQVAAVRVALEQLPESQRHAFVLRHWSGLSAGEIADVMDTTEPSVQSLLSRARAALRSDRKLARATEAVSAALFVPSARLRHNLSELIPGFGGGDSAAATTGAALATSIGAGKAALAIKGALAVVAATGVLAVGHERHVDSRALQAVGIEHAHHANEVHHRGSGGGSGRSGEPEPGDDHGGVRAGSSRGGGADGVRGGDDGGVSGRDRTSSGGGSGGQSSGKSSGGSGSTSSRHGGSSGGSDSGGGGSGGGGGGGGGSGRGGGDD